MSFLTPEPINEAIYFIVMWAAFMAVAMCRFLLSLVQALEKRLEELEAGSQQEPAHTHEQGLSYLDKMVCPEKRYKKRKESSEQ